MIWLTKRRLLKLVKSIWLAKCTHIHIHTHTQYFWNKVKNSLHWKRWIACILNVSPSASPSRSLLVCNNSPVNVTRHIFHSDVAMEPFPNWKLNFSICLHDFVFTAVLRASWSNKWATEQIPQTETKQAVSRTNHKKPYNSERFIPQRHTGADKTSGTLGVHSHTGNL